jgi:hypothetical protein
MTRTRTKVILRDYLGRRTYHTTHVTLSLPLTMSITADTIPITKCVFCQNPTIEFERGHICPSCGRSFGHWLKDSYDPESGVIARTFTTETGLPSVFFTESTCTSYNAHDAYGKTGPEVLPLFENLDPLRVWIYGGCDELIYRKVPIEELLCSFAHDGGKKCLYVKYAHQGAFEVMMPSPERVDHGEAYLFWTQVAKLEEDGVTVFYS